MEYCRAMMFAVSIGFDAFRIATFKRPKHHDLEEIVRWLRHVSPALSAPQTHEEHT